jgi:HAD superfamily hydrolase (TIGR01490 family)
LLSQQPLQLAELQPPSRGPEVPPSPATQKPFWQAPVAAQLVQVEAPEPQAYSSLPVWHSLFTSQQPLQLLRRQGTFWPVPQPPASARQSAAASGASARNEVAKRGVCTKAPNYAPTRVKVPNAVAIAFFDLDRTLISINSGQLWIRRELALGHLSRRKAAQAAVWIAQYSLGLARLEETVERAIEAIRGSSGEAFDARTESFYQRQVRPAVRPGALLAIDAHRRSRDRLVMLTSSSNYLADRAARDLGFEEVWCNRLEVGEDGLHTGRTTEGVCFGRGKLTAAHRAAERHGTLLAACTFYTDSYADLPVMEVVGRPVAVNPDLRLRRKAWRRGWEIVDWGRP